MIDLFLHATWTAAVIFASLWAYGGYVHDQSWRMYAGVVLAGLALGLPRELWDQSPWGPQKGPAPPLTLENYVAWLTDPGRASKIVDLAGYSIGALVLLAALGLTLMSIDHMRGKP